MFCPGCGSEDRDANQFCRSCGTDMRRVRTAMASPDKITASAVTAREDIGRAIAARIRETTGAEELSVVAEEVLPEVEKFLESPEEKRMRRMRAGLTVAFIGLGAVIAVVLAARFITLKDEEFVFLIGLGAVVTFFLGLALMLNGWFLTVPSSRRGRPSGMYVPEDLDLTEKDTNELPPPAANFYSSVTENTTRTLEDKKVL